MNTKIKLTGLAALNAMAVWSAVAQAPVVQVPPPAQQTELSASVAPGSSVAAPVDLSPAAAEVIRLAESGVGDQVVLSYVHSAQTPFQLSADHVLYLRDIGLSSEVISEMLTRDSTLRAAAPTVPPPEPLPPPYIPTNTAPLTAPPSVVAEAAPAMVSTPPVDVSYFYNDLAPYGSWAYLEPYGWCWQPTVVVVNRGWQPYCDSGHWIYSDCGWYWYSDYSWGWAPFHYGRWYMHDRCGWVWTPDRTWGPAWVSWRVSGSYCGWAPLPPRTYFDAHHGWRQNGISVGVSFGFGLHADHFTFVSMNNFGDHDLRHHRVANTEVRNVYKQTTVVNNYTVNNNTIVNNGVPVDRVAAASHREFRRVAVRDVPAEPGKITSTWRRTDRASSAVYRTQLKSPPPMTKVAVQKVDSSNPVIHHSVPSPTRTTYRSAERPTVSSTPPVATAPNAPQQRSDRPGSRNIERPTTPGKGVVSSDKAPIATVESPASKPNSKSWQAPKKTTTDLPTYQQPRNYSRPNPAGSTPAVSPSAPSAPSAPPARSVELQPKPTAAPTPEYQRSWERRYSSPSVSTESFDGKTTTRTYPPVQSPSANGVWNRSSSYRAQASDTYSPQTSEASQPRGQAVGNPHVFYPKSSPQASGGSASPSQSSSRHESRSSSPAPQSGSKSYESKSSSNSSDYSRGNKGGKR